MDVFHHSFSFFLLVSFEVSTLQALFILDFLRCLLLKNYWVLRPDRCSTNPVIMRFDGRIIAREVGDPTLSRIHLVSVCGIDFASRVHDHVDLTHYIKNWKEVYIFDEPWLAWCFVEILTFCSWRKGFKFVVLCQTVKFWISSGKSCGFAKEEGYPSVKHGRDFEMSGTAAQLNVSKTLYDLWLSRSSKLETSREHEG